MCSLVSNGARVLERNLGVLSSIGSRSHGDVDTVGRVSGVQVSVIEDLAESEASGVVKLKDSTGVAASVVTVLGQFSLVSQLS